MNTEALIITDNPGGAKVRFRRGESGNFLTG